MEQVNLSRYEDAGRLASGADYEVRAAVDRETGEEVVLKRPVPQMISRQLHGNTEARTERTLRVHQELGSALPGMVPILGYTEPAIHDSYFGDSLGQAYRVTVEERAVGIPLFVGDPRARITGVPVGLGQNLFALFPPPPASGQPAFPIHQQLLDLAEGFLKAGYVLLDMGPQNIFYRPATAQITVIDIGTLAATDEEPSPRGIPPKDLHDFCLETLKYYTTPQHPPTEAAGYRDPHSMRPIVRFEEELNAMTQSFDQPGDPVHAAALHVIEMVRNRSYSGIDGFRKDLASYLDEVGGRDKELFDQTPVRGAWAEALGWLRGDYWQRFSFDPETELAAFDG
jgi:hypothetical protein